VGLTLTAPTPATARSDAVVIRRSWTTPEAFGAVFDRHVDELHRYVARRLGPELADDVVADVFAAAFQQRRRYDVGRDDARPWLYGIATNLVAGHRRSEARRLRALAGQLRDEQPEGMADQVASRLSATARRAELTSVLGRLPRRQRDVVLLHAWADLTYTEIAEALDVPVGTVRSRLARARVTLRAALGAHALEQEEER
jgi:RNA polymerase sigma-70 factor (ECF subfamily)